VTKDHYSEVDFTIFYHLIFAINTRDDWIVQVPHILRAVKVIFHTNVQLALNENVIQWRLSRRPFLSCKFLVQETCIRTCTSLLYICHQHS